MVSAKAQSEIDKNSISLPCHGFMMGRGFFFSTGCLYPFGGYIIFFSQRLIPVFWGNRAFYPEVFAFLPGVIYPFCENVMRATQAYVKALFAPYSGPLFPCGKANWIPQSY